MVLSTGNVQSASRAHFESALKAASLRNECGAARGGSRHLEQDNDLGNGEQLPQSEYADPWLGRAREVLKDPSRLLQAIRIARERQEALMKNLKELIEEHRFLEKQHSLRIKIKNHGKVLSVTVAGELWSRRCAARDLCELIQLLKNPDRPARSLVLDLRDLAHAEPSAVDGLLMMDHPPPLSPPPLPLTDGVVVVLPREEAQRKQLYKHTERARALVRGWRVITRAREVQLALDELATSRKGKN